MKHPGKNFLTKKEKELLISQHKHEREGKYRDRIKSIVLLDEGWSYEQVAKALLIDHKTIRRNYKTYIMEGIDALLTMNYEGKDAFLSKLQQKELQKHLEDNTYLSSAEICTYVKRTYGIKYSTKGMIALLHRLGFVYKKPKLMPGKAEREKQRTFIEKYKELKKKLGSEDKLLFMDGVHPQHNSKPAYGWFKKGKRVHILSNTGRNRININGVVEPKNGKVIITSTDSVNAQSTIELFKKVENNYPNAKKIIIICDNARYYHSRIISKYLNTSKIKLEFLPPYSPNLNLIERLWRFMHKKITYNKYYESFDIFKNKILDFFENIEKYKSDLKKLLIDNFEIIDSQTQVL